MRKHFFTGSCLALLLFSACSKDEVKYPSLEGGEPLNIAQFVTFNASKVDYENTRSSSAFNSGDEISVSAWTGSIEKEENFIAKNSIYKCGDNGLFLPATENDTLKWKDISTPHYFIATYPKRSGISDVRALSITGDDHDMLVARHLGADGGTMPYVNDTVSLEFKHILSKVSVNVSFQDASQEKPEASKCELYFEDAADAGNLDLVTLELSAETKTNINIPSTGEYAFSGTIVPQEISNIKLHIKDSRESDFAYSGELNFESGKSYVLSFSVKERQKLTLESVTVEDWGSGELTLFEGRKGLWSDVSVTVQPEGNVYKVTNGGELYYAIYNMKDKETVQLQNDIDLGNRFWSPIDIAGANTSNRRFIDGNGYTIKGLCVDAAQATDYSNTYMAFLGEAKHTLVYDLNFEAPEIITKDNTTDAAVVMAKGNFAGVYNCKITNAVITANAGKTLDLGGIAADISNGSAVAGCLFQGNVSGTISAEAFGGLVGFAGKSMIVASYVDCNYDITATKKGLFLARSGGTTAPNRTIGCYYAGDIDVSSLNFVSDKDDSSEFVLSCSKTKFTVDNMNSVNDALNGNQGYAASTIGGVSGVNCILLQLDATYKYNYIENTGADKDKYPLVVTNVAKK